MPRVHERLIGNEWSSNQLNLIDWAGQISNPVSAYFLLVKFYWNTTIFICSHASQGCFCARTAVRLSKPKIFATSDPLRKKFLSPVIDSHCNHNSKYTVVIFSHLRPFFWTVEADQSLDMKIGKEQQAKRTQNVRRVPWLKKLRKCVFKKQQIVSYG